MTSFDPGSWLDPKRLEKLTVESVVDWVSEQLDRLSEAVWFPYAFWVVMVLVVFGLVQWLDKTPVFQNMETTLLDARIRYRATQATPDNNIVIVVTDNKTRNYYRETYQTDVPPLPRDHVAKVLDVLYQQGAKAVVLDAEFIRPNPEQDGILAAALQKHRYSYSALMMDNPLENYKKVNINPNNSRLKEFLAKNGLTLDQFFESSCLRGEYRNKLPAYLVWLGKQSFELNFKQQLDPIVKQASTYCYASNLSQTVATSLKGIGVVSVGYDPDAYIREVPAFNRGFQGEFYTYLGVRPVLDLLEVNRVNYWGDYLTLESANPIWAEAHNRKIHMLDGHNVLINWRNPLRGLKQLHEDKKLSQNGLLFDEKQLQAEIKPDQPNAKLGGGHLYRLISVKDVLTPKSKLYNIAEEPKSGVFSFKDKIVIYGDITRDVHRSPMGIKTYGPEIVATVLDSMLHDTQFVQKPPPWVVYLLIATFCFGILGLTLLTENLAKGFVYGFGLVVLYWTSSFIVFQGQIVPNVGWLTLPGAFVFPLFTPTVTMVVFLCLASLFRYYIQDREKHEMTEAFSNYVSPQILNQIVDDPTKAVENLRGEKKELTVIFSDIQGFTSQFEDEDPSKMVSQLNEYFDVMTNIILEYGGTYDKYMGDAMMAFFGAPYHLPNHAQLACAAALEMTEALKHLNANWQRQGLKPISHGIGISSGMMFVGNFGSKRIKNFTVMGSVVNLGSRLESLTRAAKMPILISERTKDLALSYVQVKDLGMAKIKGFTNPVHVYALEKLLKAVGTLSDWTKVRQ